MRSCDSTDQIEMCCNNVDSNIQMMIQAKTTEAVKLRNVVFTQSLMLPNIFLFPSFHYFIMAAIPHLKCDVGFGRGRLSSIARKILCKLHSSGID